uniref:GH16 domain-containing protein n=1 Tax=Kalanchoe fedtschenkoi TaxID=63787 RepID=A0A7N0R8S1_KALFE
MKGLFTRLSMALLWAHLINIAHSSHAFHLLKFNRDFRITQGSKNNVHISGDGNMATLMLNKKADVGAEVVSHEQFLFGRFDVKIKLLPDEQGRFTGAAASYYLIGTSGNHDEIRYDFSSNENGQGYMLGTNIVINGNRDREISFSFEFDPTKDYHTYSMLNFRVGSYWIVSPL